MAFADILMKLMILLIPALLIYETVSQTVAWVSGFIIGIIIGVSSGILNPWWIVVGVCIISGYIYKDENLRGGSS